MQRLKKNRTGRMIVVIWKFNLILLLKLRKTNLK